MTVFNKKNGIKQVVKGIRITRIQQSGSLWRMAALYNEGTKFALS